MPLAPPRVLDQTRGEPPPPRNDTRIPQHRTPMSELAIHIYCVLLDRIDGPPVREACMAVLSPEEKARAGRFVLERHREQYVLAHGLVRMALSRCAPDVEPQAWTFVADRYGRPFVAGPATAAPVHFSLTHTDGCVACAISPSELIGIDVESTARECSPLAIAEFTFSPAETAALRAAPPADQKRRFFDYWTLKEAYVKARGTGLHRPLTHFSILIESQQEIAIAFHDESVGDPARWRFKTYAPSAQHRLAVADGSGLADMLPIVMGSWPPA